MTSKAGSAAETERVGYRSHTTSGRNILQKDLKELRARYPDMRDKEFRENYTYYDWGSGLGMKFEGGKLTYLTLSVAETN
jgi:hypothetical protein